MMVAASGTLAAIAQAFGGKKTKAMAAFSRGLGGGGEAASDGDGKDMRALRKRISQVVHQGKG